MHHKENSFHDEVASHSKNMRAAHYIRYYNLRDDSFCVNSDFEHFEGGGLDSETFIKAVQCFYERPGFCCGMLHGEYVTKMKSNTTQYNNVHT